MSPRNQEDDFDMQSGGANKTWKRKGSIESDEDLDDQVKDVIQGKKKNNQVEEEKEPDVVAIPGTVGNVDETDNQPPFVIVVQGPPKVNAHHSHHFFMESLLIEWENDTDQVADQTLHPPQDSEGARTDHDPHWEEPENHPHRGNV